MVEDFFKYLTPGEEDRAWGIYVNAAGRATILPGDNTYPSPDHPSEYHFTWKRGRILKEFQINYVTRGSGLYESSSAMHPVGPGSLMITRPGAWHRYRPDPNSGWVENYVGFDGTIPRELFSQQRPWSLRPVHTIGYREEFIDTYLKIFEIVREERPGFQQVASGMIMKLLGYLVSIEKQRNFAGKRIERIIREACFEIREDVSRAIDFKEFAEGHQIGYSYFRKMFKQYTGLAPARYHLDLRIRQARELLVSTDRSIKEIAFDLGFHSIHYFSRIFKNKTGISPSELRKSK